MVLLRLGAADSGLLVAINSVWPFGAARATWAAARAPFAPTLFSTTILVPSAVASLPLIRRAMMSVALPAPDGTTMAIGLPGRLCAWLSALNSVRPETTIIEPRTFIGFAPSGLASAGSGWMRTSMAQARTDLDRMESALSLSVRPRESGDPELGSERWAQSGFPLSR